MTPNDPFYDQVCEIADRVMESSQLNRPQRIRELCGADHDLLRSVENHVRCRELNEVEPLLDATDDEQVATEWFIDSAARTPPKAEFQSERQLSDFVLQEELGHGGMGVVHRAYDKSLERDVAIKMIRFDRQSSSEHIERFRREAKAAAQLRHPHIVAIHGDGRDGDTDFFVMDYIAGGDLQSSGQLEPRRAAELTRTIALAVEHAHQKQVIHRDLKPANILVDEDGQPHITDFGLALRLDVDERLTMDDQVLGTPGYMPPEQADSKADIGPSADIYALGAILYFMLTGAPPFAGRNLRETLEAIQQREPKRPRTENPAIPRDLETICLKCLRKDPTKRYESAAALADDLDRFLTSRPISARPVGRVERTWMWAKRRPITAALVTLLVMVGVSLPLTYAAWGRLIHRANAASKAADQEKYSQLIGQVRDHWLAGKVKLALALLEQCPEAERNWEWSYLQLQCQSPTLLSNSSGQTCVAIHPNGQWIASGDTSGVVTIWDSKDRRVVAKWTCPSEGSVNAITFASNHLLAVSVGDAVIIWNAATQQQVALIEHDSPTNCIASGSLRFGAAIATSSADGVELWNAENGERIWQNDTLKSVSNLCFSHDGNFIAAAGSDQQKWAVFLLDGKSGEPSVSMSPIVQQKPIRSLAFLARGLAVLLDDEVEFWSMSATPQLVFTLPAREAIALANGPDEQTVAIGRRDGVTVYSAVKKQVIQQFRGPSTMQLSVARSGLLATLDSDRSIYIWQRAGAQTMIDEFGCSFGEFTEDNDHFVGATHGHEHVHLLRSDRSYHRRSDAPLKLHDQLTGDSAPSIVTEAIQTGPHSPIHGLHGLAVSPDGGLVATGHHSVELWDRATQESIAVLESDLPDVWNLEFSPNGKRLASGGVAEVRVWDVSTQELLTTIDVAGVAALSFSPDGRRLALSSQHLNDSNASSGVLVCDAASGERLSRLEFDQPGLFCNCVAYSPKGSRIAAVTGEGSLFVWAADSGDLLYSVKAHENAGLGVAFNPDGTRIATVGVDGGVSVWNAANGRLMIALSGLNSGPEGIDPGLTMRVLPSSPVVTAQGLKEAGTTAANRITGIGKSMVQFSRDGERLAVWGHSSRRIWSVEPKEAAIAHRVTHVPPSIERSDVVHHYCFSNDLRDIAGDAHGKQSGQATVGVDPPWKSNVLWCPAGDGLNAVMVDGAARSMSSHKDFTIGLWFKYLGLEGQGRSLGFEGKLPRLFEAFGDDANFAIGVDRSKQRLFISGEAQNAKFVVTRNAASPVPPEVWHHLALVKKELSWSVYLNGAKFKESAESQDLGILTGATLGGIQRGIRKPGDRDFQGWLDEVTVFARALTSREISDLHQDRGLIRELLEAD